MPSNSKGLYRISLNLTVQISSKSYTLLLFYNNHHTTCKTVVFFINQNEKKDMFLYNLLHSWVIQGLKIWIHKWDWNELRSWLCCCFCSILYYLVFTEVITKGQIYLPDSITGNNRFFWGNCSSQLTSKRLLLNETCSFFYGEGRGRSYCWEIYFDGRG